MWNTKNRQYKISGFGTIDIVFAVVMFLVITAAVMLSFGKLQNFARTGSEKMEMNNMRTAAISYMGSHVSEKAPTSAADLINGLSASESITGVKQDGFLSGKSDRWKNGSYVDAWGNEFTFKTESDGSHSITSNGADGQLGTDDDIIVYY